MDTRSGAPIVIAVAAGSLALSAFALVVVIQAKKSLNAYEARFAVADPESADEHLEVLGDTTSKNKMRVVLTGEVLEEVSGLPVEGAQVTLETLFLKTYSDPEGRFRFEGLDASQECALVTIDVRKAGFGNLRVVGESLHPAGRSITLLLGARDREEVVSLAEPERRTQSPCADLR